ncbi:MAG TPA: methyltransferase domain-containing protein [Burkholderiales bacterium]|nr:methyltransferase domain-containing protein [Burkholderiales bacterium]
MSNVRNLQQWFATPLGQYLLAQEQRYHDEMVADIFGFHAVQLGMPELDLLQTNRIPHKFRIGPQPGGEVIARYEELPLETQSIDLLILPHVLEFAEHPHQILREVDRVMMPEGRIIITAFNPWSLWGMRRWLGADKEHPWCGNFISLVRMKDWLTLLGFDVSAGRLGCYVPPVTQEKWISRFRFMEDAGDRWWAIGGGIYILEAIKRVQGMRIITPKWADRTVADKRLAAVARATSMRRNVRPNNNLRLIK